jgi:L-asparaginase II
MQAVPGAIAKGGAEGVLCIGLEDGSALALKAEDGSSRGLLPAAAALLDLTDLRVSTIRNSRGEAVGEITVDS